MGGFLPDINFSILSAWGFPDEGETLFPSAASGFLFGTNPPYQISDFLNVYPKFGTMPQAVQAGTLASGGSGYAVNDQLYPTQTDASGAVFVVTAVSAGGVATAVQLAQGGQGYSLANGLPTTTNNAGQGATINVTQIAAGNLMIPQLVLQLYINLASASLVQARWQDAWPLAMALFVAHFCTLYLLSDGTPAGSAGQAAQFGMARGIAVSKAAGDVSVSYETVTEELQQFGSWNRTEYGQQLATFAASIASGPIFLY